MKRIAIQLKISFIAAFMLAAGSIDAQTQTYTANGTFTVPAGVTSVQVEAWGGGGAGGGVDGVNWQNRAGGGGGGGAYVKNTSVVVTPGSAISALQHQHAGVLRESPCQ